MDESKYPGSSPENNSGQPQVPPTNLNSGENTYWESQALGQSQELPNTDLVNQKPSLEPPVEYGDYFQANVDPSMKVIWPAQDDTPKTAQAPESKASEEQIPQAQASQEQILQAQAPDLFYQSYQQQNPQNPYSQNQNPYQNQYSQSQSPYQNQYSQYQSPYQNSQPQTNQAAYRSQAFKPRKKMSPGKLIAACVVFLILISGGVAAYAFRGSLMNTFSQLTKSPAEYYAYVEGKALNNTLNDLIPYAERQKKNVGFDMTSDITLQRDTIDSLLQSSQGISLDQLESSYGIKLENFGFNLLYGHKNDITNGSLGLRLNQVDLITLEMFADVSSQSIYTRFPELSSAYLSLGPSEEDLADTEFKVPDTAKTVDFLKRYGTIVFENLSDVELQKGTQLTVDKITVKCSKITVTITEEDLYDIFLDFLEEAEDDEYIFELAKQQGITKEEYQDSIDDIRDDLTVSKDFYFEDNSFRMIVYVDSEGNIIGREFSEEDSLAGFGYHYLTKDNTNEYDVYIRDEIGDVILEGSGTQTKKDGAYDGTATITVTIPDGQNSEYTFDLEYEDYKFVYINNALCESGSFTISSPELYGIRLTSDTRVEEDTQYNTLTLLLSTSKLLTVDTTVKYFEDYEVKMPPENAEVYDSSEFFEYYSTLDVDQYLNELSAKLGVDLSSLFGSLQGSDDYYYDDYYFDDDYYYDDEYYDDNFN